VFADCPTSNSIYRADSCNCREEPPGSFGGNYPISRKFRRKLSHFKVTKTIPPFTGFVISEFAHHSRCCVRLSRNCPTSPFRNLPNSSCYWHIADCRDMDQEISISDLPSSMTRLSRHPFVTVGRACVPKLPRRRSAGACPPGFRILPYQ
jgi:hypothetical protein